MTEPMLKIDAVVACADLVGRTGARHFSIGYIEGKPQGWFAHAQYRGKRITVEDHPNPAAAASALAERLLTGARCSCGKLVALSDEGAVAYASASLVPTGENWTIEQAAAAGQCRWELIGARWEKGCR